MREESGYAIIMYRGGDPQKPGSAVGLFGPKTSTGGSKTLSSENLRTNGVKLFSNYDKLWNSYLQRRKHFAHERFACSNVWLNLKIAESKEEFLQLRDQGPYVVALGEWKELILYGNSMKNGERVPEAHDSWAPFPNNGFAMFEDFGEVIGEKGLGILSEISRQADGRVRLVSIQIKWKLDGRGKRATKRGASS